MDIVFTDEHGVRWVAPFFHDHEPAKSVINEVRSRYPDAEVVDELEDDQWDEDVVLRVCGLKCCLLVDQPHAAVTAEPETSHDQ